LRLASAVRIPFRPSADGAAALPGAPRASLLANFSWVLGGRVVYVASQWAMLVVLARLGTPEIVGQFGLALALTAPAFMLAQLGLRDLYTTERDAASFPVYLTLRLLSLGGALCWVVALALSGYTAAVAAVIVLVGAAKAVESVSDVLFAPIQREERMEYMGRSFVIRGVLTVTAMAAAMYLLRSLVAASAVMLACWTLVLLFYDIPNARKVIAVPGAFRVRWDARALRGLGWTALPLGGVALVGSLQTNTGRYLLELFSDRTSLGYFTAVAATVASTDIIIIAMTRTALSRLGAVYRTDVRAFRRELWRLAAIGVMVGLAGLAGGALLGRTLLTLAYGRAYGNAVGILLWLLVGRIALFAYTYVKAAQVVMRQLHIQLVVSLASTVLGFGVGVLLVPRLGMVGAAMSVAAGQWIALLIGSGGLMLSFARQRVAAAGGAARVPAAAGEG
jgi:O-antigen/teichoic acid export membrane protein